MCVCVMYRNILKYLHMFWMPRIVTFFLPTFHHWGAQAPSVKQLPRPKRPPAALPQVKHSPPAVVS